MTAAFGRGARFAGALLALGLAALAAPTVWADGPVPAFDDVTTRAADSAPTARDADEASRDNSDDERVIGRVEMRDKTQAGREVICRLERPVGSHVPRRVCRTRQQMADDRAEAVQRIRATQRRQSRSPNR